MGLRVYRVQGLSLGRSGLGLRVWASGFMLWALGFRLGLHASGLGFSVFRISDVVPVLMPLMACRDLRMSYLRWDNFMYG